MVLPKHLAFIHFLSIELPFLGLDFLNLLLFIICVFVLWTGILLRGRVLFFIIVLENRIGLLWR